MKKQVYIGCEFLGWKDGLMSFSLPVIVSTDLDKVKSEMDDTFETDVEVYGDENDIGAMKYGPVILIETLS